MSRKERRALRRATSSMASGIRAETSFTEREFCIAEKIFRVYQENAKYGVLAQDRSYRQLDGQMMRIQDSDINKLVDKFSRVTEHIHLQVRLEAAERLSPSPSLALANENAL